MSEAGAYTGNSLLGGLGISRPVAATEEIFTEAAVQNRRRHSAKHTKHLSRFNYFPPRCKSSAARCSPRG